MNQDEKNLFKNPPASFRIVPFWFWNGAMDESEIVFQLKEMAEKGVGGVFICARQGLEIPYLSEKWFERVKFATEKAREHGLDVWLYDEYPYPSGMSGGEVLLQHPDAVQYNLGHHSFEVSGPQEIKQELPWARVLFARAVPKDLETGQLNWEKALDLREQLGNLQQQTVFQKTGLTQYNQKRYFSYGPVKHLIWQAPAGNWLVVILFEKEIEDFKFFGSYFDPCHAEAVQTFLETTHERYAKLLSAEPKGSIKGIFSDEVGLYGDPPWSPLLLRYFKERNGYSLQDNLMALQYPANENSARVRYDYFQALHLLLRSSYHQQVKEWCEGHGLQYVAEVPAVRMTTQLYSDIPGGDSAHEKLGRSLEWVLEHYAFNLRSNPKMVSSLARQLGRERALIECFHSIGWSMTLQDAKWMIDRLGAMGIDFFNFHAFFYTLDGLRKHDAPPSQFLQNPYWTHFKKLGDYAGRLSYILSQGKALTEIAVLDPTTSLWTHLGNPFHEFRYWGSNPAEEARLNRLKKDWAFICKSLLLNQLDYDHLDPEMLTHAEVEESGSLQIGKVNYSVVVLPPLTNLEQSAWVKLKEFLRAGGTVVSLGLLPYEVIDEQQNIEAEMRKWFGANYKYYSPENYWDTETKVGQANWTKGEYKAYFLSEQGPLETDQLVSFLKEKISRPIVVEANEVDRQALLVQEREWQDRSRLIFLTNQEGRSLEVEVKTRGFKELEELDLESGEIGPVKGEFKRETEMISLKLGPYESQLLRIVLSSKESNLGKTSGQRDPAPTNDTYPFIKRGQSDGTKQTKISKPDSLKKKLEGRSWKISALQPNVARFGNFRFALDLENEGLQKNWQNGEACAEWPEVEAKTLIDQCDDLAREQKLALPIQFRQTFGTPIRVGLAYPLICWYQTAFEVDYVPKNGGVRLRMDASAIYGDYTIYLNGHELGKEDFQALREYDSCNRSSEVEALLVKGRNVLVVRVEARQDWDGLTDPLYLIGDFGVYFNGEGGMIIGAPPEKASLNGKIQSGFPYYAGMLSFKDVFKIRELPKSEEFELEFEDWDENLHDCVEVLVNDRSLGVQPWSPYRWKGSLDLLEMGENKLEVRLTNTLVGLLEGRYFDYTSHSLLTVEEF